MTNYCLCLNIKNQTSVTLDGPVDILPLNLGSNSIGRSDENSLCILNKVNWKII